MTYSFNFVVRPIGLHQWGIFPEGKDNLLYTIRGATNALQAENDAKAWASSWPSATVRVENG